MPWRQFELPSGAMPWQTEQAVVQEHTACAPARQFRIEKTLDSLRGRGTQALRMKIEEHRVHTWDGLWLGTNP